MKSLIKAINSSISIKKKLKKKTKQIELIRNLLFFCLQKNKKILICGNGGSAADAEFSDL